MSSTITETVNKKLYLFNYYMADFILFIYMEESGIKMYSTLNHKEMHFLLKCTKDFKNRISAVLYIKNIYLFCQNYAIIKSKII